MDPASVNEAVLLFVSVLLVLLILMLYAAIRQPPPARNAPEGDQPAQPSLPSTARAAVRRPAAPADARSGRASLVGSTAQFGRTRYEGRHDGGSKLARNIVQTLNSPPWGPAPRPPDVRR